MLNNRWSLEDLTKYFRGASRLRRDDLAHIGGILRRGGDDECPSPTFCSLASGRLVEELVDDYHLGTPNCLIPAIGGDWIEGLTRSHGL